MNDCCFFSLAQTNVMGMLYSYRTVFSSLLSFGLFFFLNVIKPTDVASLFRGKTLPKEQIGQTVKQSGSTKS